MTTVGIICKKRLLGEIKLLKKDPHKYIDVAPDESDILIWYFLVKGPEFSDFKDGYYIGKIMHNPEYPLKPPDFMMLTPSGRFHEGNKICLSNSSYHSNEWSALWNIHTILTGFLSIMLDDKEHGISHIHCTKEERLHHAKNSIGYNKKNYPNLLKLFTRFLDENGNPIPDESQSSPNQDKHSVQTTSHRSEKSIQQPVIEKPIQQPVIEKPIQQPVIVQSIQQPVIKQSIQQPVIEKPIQQPVIKQSIQQPVIKQPVIEKPIQQPVIKQLNQHLNSNCCAVKKTKFDIENLPIKNYSQTVERYNKIVAEITSK